MSIKYSDFIVQPMKMQRYKILKEIRFLNVKVPKGYRTNGGNIPRPVWMFLSPYDPEMLPLYIIHDYLCDKEKYKKADEYLWYLGKELHVAKWKLNIVHLAVRAYHKIWYNS